MDPAATGSFQRSQPAAASGSGAPHAAHTILVEKSANRAEIIAALTRELPGVLPVTVSTDKVTRAIAASPPLESGNVYVPGSAARVSESGGPFANLLGIPNGDRVLDE